MLKDKLRAINNLPIRLTVRHEETFGAETADLKGGELDSPESWDALRRANPHFSISPNREEWLQACEAKIKKDGQDGGLLVRARTIVDLLRVKSAESVFSVGSGGAGLEYQIKKMIPQIRIVCSEYARELNSAYPELSGRTEPKAEINRHEFKVYSQYGEDGILLYLFSILGTTNKRFVEFGVNDGRECLTANLSINFGWSGLLIEGDPEAFVRAKTFYRSLLPGPASDRVKMVNAIVTAENINRLLNDNRMSGEIDFLSIDIDGNDYWVWKAINAINPRIVVIEYNGILGNDRPLTVKYQPDFKRFEMNAAGYYYGTSLPAAAKLAANKGYVFVGCESSGGVNAFFVRKDVAEGKISPVTIQQGFYPQIRRAKDKTMEDLFAQIKHLPLEEV